MTIELRRVESKEPENTVPFVAWNTQNFKPEYLVEWKAPWVTITPGLPHRPCKHFQENNEEMWEPPTLTRGVPLVHRT